MLGSPAAASDAEVISMVFHMFRELGIGGTAGAKLHWMSPPAAPILKRRCTITSARREELCDTCKDRLERNPMCGFWIRKEVPFAQEIGKARP